MELKLDYVGPLEVYRADMDSVGDVRLLWEELLLEREAFDRSRLYFTEYDWDMPAHMVNAYYWPFSNTVYVTSAIVWWLLDGADEVSATGRLGMLLGHELGHAVHSNIDALGDVGARAMYNAGKTCLAEEYGVNGQTVHEDMADRIAFSVVGALASELPSYKHTLCPIDGCRDVTSHHLAFIAAVQPFVLRRPQVTTRATRTARTVCALSTR